jgi:hypothetical protein
MTKENLTQVQRVQNAFFEVASTSVSKNEVSHTNAWNKLMYSMHCKQIGDLSGIITSVPIGTIYSYVSSRRFPPKQVLLKIADDLNKNLGVGANITVPGIDFDSLKPVSKKPVSGIVELLALSQKELSANDSIDFPASGTELKMAPRVADGLSQRAFSEFIRLAHKCDLGGLSIRTDSDGKGIIIRPIDPAQPK